MFWVVGFQTYPVVPVPIPGGSLFPVICSNSSENIVGVVVDSE